MQDYHIKLRLLSKSGHSSQIVTGFLLLAQKTNKYHVELESLYMYGGNCSAPSIVECEYRGLKIAYDTMDGYFDGIGDWVEKYDLYFKRSYSKEKNKRYVSEKLHSRIMPLGFNYHVVCQGNPYEMASNPWKSTLRSILGRKNADYFTPEVFEKGMKKEQYDVIFFTRLWEPEEALGNQLNEERKYINRSRIELIIKLRELCGDRFIGGLSDSSFSRKMAPELIVSKRLSRRENYLKILHSSRIAIGTMGLHESIGWKTGEYVAAAKAIVNERFHYDVPGEFLEGRNYLPFDNVDQCLQAVKFLLENPEKTVDMQCHNRHYYEEFLAPDIFIERTLRIADTYCRGGIIGE